MPLNGLMIVVLIHASRAEVTSDTTLVKCGTDGMQPERRRRQRSVRRVIGAKCNDFRKENRSSMSEFTRPLATGYPATRRYPISKSKICKVMAKTNLGQKAVQFILIDVTRDTAGEIFSHCRQRKLRHSDRLRTSLIKPFER